MGSSSSSPIVHSYREFQTIEFLLRKSIPKHGVIFEEVSESDLQPGDMVLFPLDISFFRTSDFRHAAVYLGDEEVIHFQSINSEMNTGRISKQSFRAIKKGRGKCRIYRKIGGIDLTNFHKKVKAAMKSEANYHMGKTNCIHFALYLLGLVHFYKDLVEIPNKDGNCGSGANSKVDRQVMTVVNP